MMAINSTVRIGLLSLLIVLLFAGASNAQSEETYSVPAYTGDVQSYLSLLEEISGFTVSYSPDVIDAERELRLGDAQGTLEEVLRPVLEQCSCSFTVRDDKILIIPGEGDHRSAITVSGYIKDGATGETLTGSTIAAKDILGISDVVGTVSNPYGFFALTIPASPHILEFAYLGYTGQGIRISGQRDTIISIGLAPGFLELSEVVVEESKFIDPASRHVESPQMGKVQLDIAEIKELPTFLGEVDLVKSVQLLPGVNVQGEGSTNYYVRGGGADQNLILLDEAPVYNPSHLMGFFSSFNQDALHSVDFYKGGFPARLGGRLSSVMEVRMKEGNSQEFGVSGGIGTAAARLTLEGPLKKGKSSFIISARRTYADLFLKLSNDAYTRETSIYFYDLNAKFNFTLGEKDRLFVSGYFGRDLNKIRSLQYSIDWGNATGTLRWNHIFGKRLFSNMSLIASNYDYLIDLPNIDRPFDWSARIKDYGLKYDLNYFINPDFNLEFGLHSTYHQIKPGVSSVNPDANVPESRALEHALYVSAKQDIGSKLSLEYGLRFTLFQLMGPGVTIEFDQDGAPVGETSYSAGEIYQTYTGIEPRLNAGYQLADHLAVKAGYSRNFQYLNMLSNLSLGFNVFDVWIPSNENIKPQQSDLVTLGLFFDSRDRKYQFSIEGYYKWMENQLDFRDHATLIMNRYIEGELLPGSGRAYGVEFLARKSTGRLKGWVGYAWSRSFLTVEGVNDGSPYPSNHDQPHSFNVSGSYRLGQRWSVSANFVYSTGRPVTLPVETYWYDGRIVPVYGERNANRLPAYHRLDISANLYRKKKEGRRNESYWTFGIYNVYNRKNASAAFLSNELEDIDVVADPNKSEYYKLFLIGIMPSVTYNFKF